MKTLFLATAALTAALTAVLTSTPCFAQWTNDSSQNTLVTESLCQTWETAGLSDGSTVIYYTYPERLEDGTFAMKHYLQLLDKDGYFVWDEPLFVSHAPNRTYTMVNKYLFIDANDNILISIPDTRYDTANNFDIFMNTTCYKISKTGEFLWGQNGVRIDNSEHDLIAQVNAVALENGNIVLAYLEQDNNPLSIKMTCLSDGGEFRWKKDLKINGVNDGNTPKIVNGGNNEFIVVYTYGSASIAAQKFDLSGEEVWGHTIIYNRGALPSAPAHTWLEVIPVERGAFVSWCDDRDGNNFEDAYCNYVDRDGQLLSNGTDGVKLGYSISMRQFTPVGAYDAVNKFVYYTWSEMSFNQTHARTVGQKLSLSGELVWEPEAVEITPFLDRRVAYQSVQTGKDGGAAFFCLEETNSNKDYNGIAQYRSVNGDSVLWNTCFTSNSGAEDGKIYTKTNLSVLPLRNNQWVAIWDDTRPEANANLTVHPWAQNISIDGTLGVVEDVATEKPVMATTATVNFRVSKNPVSDKAEFTVANLKGSNVDISILNPLGKQVGKVFNGRLSSDNQTFSWNVSVAKGIYFAVLRSDNKAETVKMIVK
ncbi:MAG: T9SS type A sorting domain-containing protein [Bacteroidales bacterium]|nr:T9SS type A sorting domain-containing protein [Bacteroidales bacterium]